MTIASAPASPTPASPTLTTPTSALHTDDEILERIKLLVGPACYRQWWLMFLDRDCYQFPTVLPLEDYPYSPDEGHAAHFASAIEFVADRTNAAQVIFVWERYGDSAATRADRAWARTLGTACAELGVKVRGQLLSHSSGVRWLTPEECQ